MSKDTGVEIETDTDMETQRHAHYCAQCQMTVKLFSEGGEKDLGCRTGCHSRTLAEVA